ncbi:MAG: cyclase family protein [Mycobacteriales bacterium]
MTGSNWGRWGPEDEAGALNLIGSEQVLRATALVREGRVVRLGQPLDPLVPGAPHRKRVERFMTRDGGDYAAGARRPHGFQFAEEVWSFAAHSGTHMDALAHVWCEDRLYNGYPSSGVRSTTGAQRCGAAELRPVVTRGLLLDVAAGRGHALVAGEAVTASELQAAADCAQVQPEPGDAILVRTGWLAACGDDLTTYFAAEPGIDRGAAQWLADADVAVVGSDNYAVEVQPSAPGTSFPAHQLLLRDHGVPLIENLLLDELARAGATAFLLVAAPLQLVGGTAGPLSPVAVL